MATERALGRDLSGVILSTLLASLPIYLAVGFSVQLQRDMQFGAVELGTLVSVYYLSAAVLVRFWGGVLERLGAARVMQACTLGATLCLVFMGHVANTFGDLLAMAIAAGVFNAGTQLASNQWISRRVPHGRQGVVFGVKQAGIPAATLLAGVSVPLVGVHFGWKPVFVSAAVLSFLVVILLVPRPVVDAKTYRQRFPPTAIPVGQRWPLIWLAGAAGAGVSAACGMSGFLVASLVGQGYSESSAGVLLAIGGLSSVSARIAVGLWADRFNMENFTSVVVMLGLGACGYFLFGLSSSMPAVVNLIATFLGFAAGWGWGGALNHLIVQRFRAQPARATGIVQIGLQVGGVLGPFLFGVLYEMAGDSTAWLVMCFFAVVAAVAMWILSARLPGGTPPETVQV